MMNIDTLPTYISGVICTKLPYGSVMKAGRDANVMNDINTMKYNKGYVKVHAM